MVLNYTGTVTSDMIVADLQEHMDWFTNIIRVAFYYAGQDVNIEEHPPRALINYIREHHHIVASLDGQSLSRIDEMHNDLSTVAKQMLDMSRASQPITHDIYQNFEQLIDSYALELRRLQDQILQTGISIDPVTGLRSTSGMKDDLKRERDRRDRKDVPFCIANLRIDANSIENRQLSRPDMERIYSGIAKTMTEILRSFDDAYHLGEGEFILCLKHIDILDACRVMERFIHMIADTEFVMADDRVIDKVTLSGGVVEPLPENSIEDMLENAARMRDEACAEGGCRVIEYTEKSQLEQMSSSGDLQRF